MNKYVISVLAIIIIVFLGLGAFALMIPKKSATTTTTVPVVATPTTAKKTTTPSPKVTSAKTFTLADVSTHNSQSSCWSAIDGQVYDLTDWIRQHPGGAARILSICGIDGSRAYNQQHSGERRASTDLAAMLIGTLSSN